jgi:hypothetical protein
MQREHLTSSEVALTMWILSLMNMNYLSRNTIFWTARTSASTYSVSVHEVWEVVEGLQEFYDGKWDELKAQIWFLFNADSVKHRYTERDLKEYVHSLHKKAIKSLQDY